MFIPRRAIKLRKTQVSKKRFFFDISSKQFRKQLEMKTNTTIIFNDKYNTQTNYLYFKYAEITGLEFLSLLGDVRPTATRRHSNKSRNAVLSWLDGDQTREIRLVITGVEVGRAGKSIAYTAEFIDPLSGVQALVSPHLYIDRYYKTKDTRSEEYQYPMQTSSRALYTLKNRRPSPRSSPPKE